MGGRGRESGSTSKPKRASVQDAPAQPFRKPDKAHVESQIAKMKEILGMLKK